MKKINAKQKKFADEYIITGNAEKSALAAGYSKNYSRAQAHKLLVNVGIKKYMDERLKEINDKKILTIEEAMQITTRIARGEARKIIKQNAMGDKIESLEYPSYNDINKALEHYYKVHGKLRENISVDANITTPASILSDILEAVKGED